MPHLPLFSLPHCIHTLWPTVSALEGDHIAQQTPQQFLHPIEIPKNKDVITFTPCHIIADTWLQTLIVTRCRALLVCLCSYLTVTVCVTTLILWKLIYVYLVMISVWCTLISAYILMYVKCRYTIRVCNCILPHLYQHFLKWHSNTSHNGSGNATNILK